MLLRSRFDSTRHLNLDRTARNYRVVKLPMREDSGLSFWHIWLLLRVLLLAAIRDRACGFHLFYDADDNRCRMLNCFPWEGDAWYETVPPPMIVARQIIDLVREYAHLDENHQEGRISYVFAGQRRSASCVSPHLNDLQIYFGSYRPRVLNKSAGDLPATPAVAPHDPEDLPSYPPSFLRKCAPQFRNGEPLIVLVRVK